MTARQARIVAVLCALFVFAATATVLNAWQEFADQLTALAGLPATTLMVASGSPSAACG